MGPPAPSSICKRIRRWMACFRHMSSLLNWGLEVGSAAPIPELPSVNAGFCLGSGLWPSQTLVLKMSSRMFNGGGPCKVVVKPAHGIQRLEL